MFILLNDNTVFETPNAIITNGNVTFVAADNDERTIPLERIVSMSDINPLEANIEEPEVEAVAVPTPEAEL